VYLTRQPGAIEAFFDRYSFDWLEFTRRIASGDLGLDTFAPLITHMFLHGGWLHLIGNVLYLWIFGDNVEDRFGSVQYLIFYVLCGTVAAIGQGLIAPGPMVGASGAIAGVLGAYLVLSPTARVSTLVFLGFFITIVELPALFVIGMFIVLQILEGVAELRVASHAAAQHIAYFAHICGFAAGLLLLVFFRRGDAARRTRFG
jgi:membrane associated rhomboid family serine protease